MKTRVNYDSTGDSSCCATEMTVACRPHVTVYDNQTTDLLPEPHHHDTGHFNFP